METQFEKLSAGIFASGSQIVWNRFERPGWHKTKRPQSLIANAAFEKIILAATYVPAPFPAQYHRPSEA
jgi:hypothetical protein